MVQSVAERIRAARRNVDKAKKFLAKSKNPHKREALMRIIATLEATSNEPMRRSTTTSDTVAQARARARIAAARLDEMNRLADERAIREAFEQEARSAVGQARKYHEETVAAFTRAAATHRDPVKPISPAGTWQGKPTSRPKNKFGW